VEFDPVDVVLDEQPARVPAVRRRAVARTAALLVAIIIE
jgi:hypothetical protein